MACDASAASAAGFQGLEIVVLRSRRCWTATTTPRTCMMMTGTKSSASLETDAPKSRLGHARARRPT